MEKHKVLDQLLENLQLFLLSLERENLSSDASVQKRQLSNLLQSYRCYNGNLSGTGDEEYIYMNKVLAPGTDKEKASRDHRPDVVDKGSAAKHVPMAPLKSLPDLPAPRTVARAREPFPLPPAPAFACLESQEGYYEEAQPYEETVNDDGEAVSSSYESYDEEEVTKGKSSAQHQWPSTEASIELMKDARICAFLWRKKWLGQWAKQLCVIREQRLLCYKSSKEQVPLLDVSLLGCSVVYKEKQPKKKEHKLKITPMGGEAIVLGLQSKEQTEQWLKVIQEISPKPVEGSEIPAVSDSPRLICTKGEVSEKNSVTSESGSSTDSHADSLDCKDVKKKYGAGLKFSNLMNIGKKKTSTLDSSEKCVNTSGYLNVLVNSQWRSHWCLIKNGQLWFYQDKGKTKSAQQPLPLEGCRVLPDPSPDHLYSFRIQMDGAQVATLEAKSSADMGHWLGLLLSQTGTKTDPEELTYDYVNSERVFTIVNAAKTSLYLMQSGFSEPNAYIDRLSVPSPGSDIYDDVASIEADPEEAEESSLHDEQETSDPSGLDSTSSCGQVATVLVNSEQDTPERIYLDIIPVRSFLHTSRERESPNQEPVSRSPSRSDEQQDLPSQVDFSKESESEHPVTQNGVDSTAVTRRPKQERPLSPNPPQPQPQSQKTSLPSHDTPVKASPGTHHLETTSTTTLNTQISKTHPRPTSNSLAISLYPHSPQPPRGRSSSSGEQRNKVLSTACPGAIEIKLGKNRTVADMQLYTEERERLEKEREAMRNSLANLKKERRETKEILSTSQDPVQLASLDALLKQNEEACREAEHRRVEVELQLMEVKESLRKAEAGPFSLGTTLDSSLLDTPTAKVLSTGTPQLLSPPTNNGDPSPVNSATALKNRPLSIMSSNKGTVMQKAKEWEKKST
ncbi:hypothetical protein DPEC_G00356940 [Dallia pectoralis]|uniref:Uncharacterized protein n=1 Tax=Dallia pectoralis TaxID=75939 RepID=A0ACC2EZX3_DALPE|nr:hypothetical protein DPEC_G00356940 [Dallia pectoralis]